MSYREWFSSPDGEGGYPSPREAVSNVLDPDTEIAWWLLVFPKVVLFSAVLLFPFVFAIWISLHEWNPIAQEQTFIGLDNYVRMVDDPVFHNSIVNTIGYAAAMVLVSVPISLGVALLLDTNVRGTGFYSAAIFLPVVTSWVVVSLIWVWIYNPDYGVLNAALSALGLPTFDWLHSTSTSLLSITIMSIWKTVGFNMVIFLAGLRNIPDSYYEAARMDGANAYQRFRYVTLPLLKPTTFFVVLVTLIMSFRLFTQVFVMTDGGPVNSSYSLVFYFYERGFQQFEMGYASAIAVVLFVFVFLFSVLQERTWGDDVEY